MLGGCTPGREAITVSNHQSPRAPRESGVERRIREAQERGEFDNLPGAGKPLPDLGRPYDEMWWVRKKLRSEGISYLPPTMQLRKDVEEALERAGTAPSEAEVRAIVRETNEHIRYANRTALAGPPSTVAPLDEDEVVRRWRQRRAEQDR